MAKGTDFFDDEANVAAYMAHRQWAANPNDTLEKPIVLELVGNVRGKHVLDLGCGDGLFGVELLHAGAASYLGVEPSSRMLALARGALAGTGSEVCHSTAETFDYPRKRYDLVVSRLALHYVDDLAHTFGNVHGALKRGGRFVFSVLHPVITASPKSAEGGGLRQDWIVDDYFVRGKRQVPWLGATVEQVHRTVEDYFACLQGAGFTVERLRESEPDPRRFADGELLRRRRRIPLFLLFAASKA